MSNWGSMDNYANCNTDGYTIDDQAICEKCNKIWIEHDDEKCDFVEMEYDDGDRAYDEWKDGQAEMEFEKEKTEK